MLTDTDLVKIQKLIQDIFNPMFVPVVKELLRLGQELEDVQEKIKYLPTKDEFFERELQIYSRLVKIEEAVEMQSGYKDQLENHEERLVMVESRVW